MENLNKYYADYIQSLKDDARENFIVGASMGVAGGFLMGYLLVHMGWLL